MACVCVCHAPNLGAVPSQRPFSPLKGGLREQEDLAGTWRTEEERIDLRISLLLCLYVLDDRDTRICACEDWRAVGCVTW
eukprot:3385909-Prymnesium_polylepis.1